MQQCHYNAQGAFICNKSVVLKENKIIEAFKEQPFIIREPEPWVVKNQCKGCEDCPAGTYCLSCKDCQMLKMSFGGKDIDMLQCKCPSSLVDDRPKTTVLGINRSYCDIKKTQDISNCDGNLKCGICSKSIVYST
jgi:hypothetical protein